jgi:hypothetical protein
VQHRALEWRREVQLEVAVVVPAEGAHAIPWLQPKVLERVRQTMDTLSELGVRIAMLTRKSTSHKLAIGKQACPPIEDEL